MPLTIKEALSGLDQLHRGEDRKNQHAKEDRRDHHSPSYVHRTPETRGDELELRIAKRAHLRQVETLELRLGADPLADEDVHEPVEDIGDREDDPDQGTAADELRHELARVDRKSTRLN